MSLPSFRAGLIFLFAVTVAVAPSLASRSHRGPTSGHWKIPSKKPKAASKIHGQRQIESSRAAQIQEALIKQNYLTGEPSGQWDQQTEAAMRKFQADHGWQTKLMPDSRALIKLGLGPIAAPVAEHKGSQSFMGASPGGGDGESSLLDAHRLTQ